MSAGAALRRAGRVSVPAIVILLAAACGDKTRDQPVAVAPAGGGEGSAAPQERAGAPLAPVPSHAPSMPGQGARPGHEALRGGAPEGEGRWIAPREWIALTPSSQMRPAP